MALEVVRVGRWVNDWAGRVMLLSGTERAPGFAIVPTLLGSEVVVRSEPHVAAWISGASPGPIVGAELHTVYDC